MRFRRLLLLLCYACCCCRSYVCYCWCYFRCCCAYFCCDVCCCCRFGEVTALSVWEKDEYHMFGSQFCLFGSFLRPSGRGFVLILDVQFHEYLSITIFTLISFSIKIYSSSFSFILLGFRELPMVSLILHIAPLLISLDSSLDSFCSSLACENYVFIYMFILCICIYIYVCIYGGVFIYGYVCICLDTSILFR